MELHTLVNWEDGMTFSGNTDRIKAVMERAKKGEAITVGFLGGSITQGSLSSTPDTCYAALTAKWWRETFPQSEITYINAGIGGTTSQFGVARVEQDLLCYRPDFVVIEFSVNDENTLFFRETYEGLVRKVYGAEFAPAVLLVHNVFYETGTNAQDQHETIGRYYNIPCVSIKTSVYQAAASGKIARRDITPDDLHPNDAGHRLLADLLIYFLEKVKGESESMSHAVDQTSGSGVGSSEKNTKQNVLPTPITRNAYENSVRYQNYNSSPELSGFVADTEPQNVITDIFKRGFIGKSVGDSITFEIEGSGIAIQYRKSVKHPACIAKVVLDGEEDRAVVLDGNFEETWGDCLFISTIAEHVEEKKHSVKITVVDAPEDAVPFYLVSVIGSK